MVSERWIDGDSFPSPDSGFTVVHLPVFGFVAVVGDVAAKSDKVGVGIGDGADELLANLGIGGGGVGRVSKSSVPVCDEAARRVRLYSDVDRPALRRARQRHQQSNRKRTTYVLVQAGSDRLMMSGALYRGDAENAEKYG